MNTFAFRRDGSHAAGESDAEIVDGVWDFAQMNRRYARHLTGPRSSTPAARCDLKSAICNLKSSEAWRRQVEVLRAASRQLRTFNRA